MKNSIIVIKYGGNAMIDEQLQKDFANNLAQLKDNHFHPVVIHGGGPQISEALNKNGIKTQFINGERVTDKPTLEIVEMVLSGNVNKHIVQLTQKAGANAVGISGKDAHLIYATTDPQKKHLGFVGKVSKVNPAILHTLIENDFIPIISPVSTSQEGITYNVNADFAAAAIAASLQAEKLLLLTNIRGVLDKQNVLIPQLTPSQIDSLIADRTISDGMIPKINCALDALNKGVNNVQIIDGRIPNVLKSTLFEKTLTGTSLKRDAN
jgi:acetylglutamate kinase